MSIIGPNGDKCLEPGPLACTRLLLQGHNPQNLVLEGCPPEKVSDGQRKEIDLQGPDFRVLDQATQLGDRDPLLILSLTSESSMASTPTPTLTLAATSAWMFLPNPLRKPLQLPIPGPPEPLGPPGPPAAPASSAMWCFLGKKRHHHGLFFLN